MSNGGQRNRHGCVFFGQLFSKCRPFFDFLISNARFPAPGGHFCHDSSRGRVVRCCKLNPAKSRVRAITIPSRRPIPSLLFWWRPGSCLGWAGVLNPACYRAFLVLNFGLSRLPSPASQHKVATVRPKIQLNCATYVDRCCNHAFTHDASIAYVV